MEWEILDQTEIKLLGDIVVVQRIQEKSCQSGIQISVSTKLIKLSKVSNINSEVRLQLNALPVNRTLNNNIVLLSN